VSKPKKGFLGVSIPVIVGFTVVIISALVIGFIGGPLGKGIIGDLGMPSWLDVPQPKPELPAEVVFNTGGFPVTNSIIGSWITMLVLVVVCYLVTRRIKLIPGRLQGILEGVIGWLFDFCTSVAGEKNGRMFFPFIATIFLFVSMNSWLSLIPGFGSINILNPEGHYVHLLRGANTDINVPLALALLSFVFVEYYGLKTLGIRYLGKFFNFGMFFKSVGLIFRGKVKSGLSGLITGVINIFVGVLELLSELVRIVSFTFRLFGNMTAGEILLLITAFLIPWIFPIPFYGLELLVGVIQALIFAGLTLVFMTVAVTSHDEEHTA